MNFNKDNRLLKKLFFLKQIGYKFIDKNFLSLSNYHDYNNIDELNREVKKCSLCSLRNSSKGVTAGIGNENSKIMFILFSKKNDSYENNSKKFLENAIKNSLNLDIKEIYISSLLRCEISQSDDKSPILNRSIELCRPYLFEEIRLIKPKIIVTLGEKAFMHLYPNLLLKGGFSSIRGSILKNEDSLILPTFSPEWISKNPSFENIFIDDLRKIKGVI